ncbi:MAG: DUF4124 domain-containing protein [Psychromonas sp.]|nr:DUF4124 domain-containing protein [Alteromonadales bacterium]MCP5078240.1 DUF4124 domain-containing protein [Psychromonas sp.]
MKFSLSIISTLLYLFSSIAIAGDTKIYHWVDENGKIHFSDTAVPGTEQINVKNNNLLSSGEADSNEKDAVFNKLSIDDKEYIKYQATITSPEDDKPLRSNDGTINIHVATEPEKENTQKLQLYLDGKKLGLPQISPTMRALNIDRGTHQVQVELLDENGKVLAKTQVVTVHLQRAGK